MSVCACSICPVAWLWTNLDQRNQNNLLLQNCSSNIYRDLSNNDYKRLPQGLFASVYNLKHLQVSVSQKVSSSQLNFLSLVLIVWLENCGFK